MPNNHPFVAAVNALLDKLNAEPKLDTAIELAQVLIRLLGCNDEPTPENIYLDSTFDLPNAERYDSWFQPHPIFKSDRAVFDLVDAPLFQAKFYWLKKHSRQIVAGGVHFTPNFEDEDFTHNERYKVGIDFFLSPNGRSLSVVLSNRGNLRIVELNKRLNSTQVDIFSRWLGADNLNTQSSLHSTLWESFKLKSVNQKFYDGVANSFNELFQHLKSIKKDDEESKLFASRLLGRLLFCWFLRKKGIIDENVGYFNAKDFDSTEYYRINLERLFFLTLNTPVDDRELLGHSDIKTPYLNGGLFEPHENDWYKDNKLTFPEGFFTSLFEHFEQFNFTTDESSPEYELIAIDPEMLGRVFESLLATQLDESGQQARKAKGAFYTPREIVSYMCKESLRNYLYNAVGNGDDTKASIDSLLDISDSEWAKAKSNTLRDKIKDYRMHIIDALDAVTILDPACGSGAFPMGMLQLIVKMYERLDGRFDPYKTKLQIIRKNIYGVDIEPMAVEIARLRAWLSLVVDEEDGRNVEPLPNLDFKFVCANSLILLDSSTQVDWLNSANSDLHEKLANLRNEYFNARKPHTKKAAQDKYYKLTKAPEGLFDDNRTKQLKSFDPFKNSHPADFFDADQMFGLSDGFDIVIGNPPYGAKISAEDKSKIVGALNLENINLNSAGLFIDNSLSYKLSACGILAYIVPKSLLYSESWQCNVRRLIDKTSILVDVEKAFEDVKLEQVVFVYNNRDSDCYEAKKFLNDIFVNEIKIDKTIYKQLHAWICDVTDDEIRIATRLQSFAKLSSISETKRGLGLQKKLKEKGDVKFIGGKNIARFKIDGEKGYVNNIDFPVNSAKLKFFMRPKIVSQDLVAHIQNPRPHIKITSAVDHEGTIVGLDTVQNTVINDSNYPLDFIATLLNSRVVNWYMYKFIYCSAIRTMHLDSYYIGKIPLPPIAQLRGIDLSNFSESSVDEKVMNQAVYELYGMSPDEIKVIEGMFQ